jgi:hypothetical protein
LQARPEEQSAQEVLRVVSTLFFNAYIHA